MIAGSDQIILAYACRIGTVCSFHRWDQIIDEFIVIVFRQLHRQRKVGGILTVLICIVIGRTDNSAYCHLSIISVALG